MTNRGRVVDRGRGRAVARGVRGGRGSPVADRGRGGAPPSLRGADRGGGRGFQVRGGAPRGRGRGSVFMQGQPADIDPRIADDSDKAVVASLNSAVATRDSSAPLRPNFGTDGREIKLRTNFFPVVVPQGTMFYAYNVTFAPSHVLRRLKKRIYDLAARTTSWVQSGMALPGRIVHDNGTMLISAYPLPQPLTITVPYYGEDESGPPINGGRTYTLTIVFIQKIDTGQLMSYLAGQIQYRHYNASLVVSALKLIVTSFQTRNGVTIWPSRYFSLPAAEPFRLGGGVEAWRGIYTTMRPVYKQLMLNANLCTAAFYTAGNLAHAIMALQDMYSSARVSTLLRGVRIEAAHLGRRKVIRRLVPLTARTCSIDAPEYGQVTVEEYLGWKYNIQLHYPDLQLIEVDGQTSYLPAELCEILPGQRLCGKFLPLQEAVMASVASPPPNVHGEKTVTQLRHQLGLNVIRPELESFGITIGPNMAVVPGRVLSKPNITYASSAATSIGDYATWNLIGVKFAAGARLDDWAVLVIKDGVPGAEFAGSSDGNLRDVVFAFRHMCSTSGMRITADPTYATAQLPGKGSELFDPMRQGAIRTIKNTLMNIKPKPALVLVMLANGDKAIYDGMKQLCDVRLDVATVCVQSSKIRKRDLHYLANVALKTNMKLGGVNQKLEGSGGQWLRNVPTMVVGMDVTHPSPGSSVGCPSIVAVVASMDSHFAQYPAVLEIQSSSSEMITNLRDMMIDRLKLFEKKNNGKLPERILVYRNGVPENQFKTLRNTELASIIQAFGVFNLGTPYRPKVTVVACSKSRHVRFYPTEQDNAMINGNPLPGTVVDRGITSIYNFDFYLQSHGTVAQGTAHPTRYCVIHDEIGFNANDIQGVTNALSYVFARATQAVSLVCPAYYADAACKRGRCYLRKLFHGYVGDGGATANDGSQTGSRDPTGQEVKEEAQRLWGWGVAGAALKDTMFYL